MNDLVAVVFTNQASFYFSVHFCGGHVGRFGRGWTVFGAAEGVLTTAGVEVGKHGRVRMGVECQVVMVMGVLTTTGVEGGKHGRARMGVERQVVVVMAWRGWRQSCTCACVCAKESVYLFDFEALGKGRRGGSRRISLIDSGYGRRPMDVATGREACQGAIVRLSEAYRAADCSRWWIIHSREACPEYSGVCQMLILAVIPVIFVLILASALLAVARRWVWAALFLAGAVVLNVCTKQIPLNLSYAARGLFSYACARSSQDECAGDRGGISQCETQGPSQSARPGQSECAGDCGGTSQCEVQSPAPTEAPTPIPLRVFEYNVCAKGEMQAMHDDGFIDFILSQDADILFLPENLYYTDQKLDTVLSEHYPYSVYANLSSKLWPEEMGIYSRYPLRDITRLPSPFNAWGSDMMMSAVARVGDIDVQLLHLHCYSNSHGIRKGYEGRDLEAMDITALLSETAGKGMPTIVAGDLNDLNGSRLLRSIESQGLRDLWWKGGTGMGFTFSEGLLRFRLDHILATSHFDLKRIKVINQKRYSDHRPIVADLELVPTR